MKVMDAIKAHVKKKPLTKDGKEVPDPIPMDPPIGYKAQPSMFEVMRDMIRQEKERATFEGLETPEEADDFDVGDDYEPSSPYEHNFDHVVDPVELKRLRDALELRDRELRAKETSATPAGSGGSGGGPPAEPASASGPGQAGGPAGS